MYPAALFWGRCNQKQGFWGVISITPKHPTGDISCPINDVASLTSPAGVIIVSIFPMRSIKGMKSSIFVSMLVLPMLGGKSQAAVVRIQQPMKKLRQGQSMATPPNEYGSSFPGRKQHALTTRLSQSSQQYGRHIGQLADTQCIHETLALGS